VLATSTINRIMVVELALPAVLPGALVTLHYAVQMLRPRFGHGADRGGALTRWIVGGMAVLAVGVVAAAASVALLAVHREAGLVLAVGAYLIIGLGVGACGTTLLVLLATGVAPARRAAAATIAWVTMIAGFVITTAVAGQLLEPYTHAALVRVATGVAVAALAVTVLATFRVMPGGATPAPARPREHAGFGAALREVWREAPARRFTLFVFVSMLAFSGQELVFEPFAGAVLGLTPAQSARLTSLQHGGALAGMIFVALLGVWAARSRFASLRGWIVTGCIGSSLALAGLALAAHAGAAWPLRGNAFLLGFANGTFTVSAIGSMMALAAVGGAARQGIRMGLWGGAQAVAFALGGLLSSAAVDLTRGLTHSPLAAYACVFAAQACLWVLAAALAASVTRIAPAPAPVPATRGRDATPLRHDGAAVNA